MNNLDKFILTVIQRSVPLTERPFKAIGDLLGYSETEIIARIDFLKNESGVIRNISAIFNPHKLGYASVLVAFKADLSTIIDIADKISELKSVSHNYQRDCEYNIWFTYTYQVNQDCGELISQLAKDLNVTDFLILPSITHFKTNVIFEMAEIKADINSLIPESVVDKGEFILNDLNKQVIRQLQIDLPIKSKPYNDLASQINLNILDFLVLARSFQEQSVMKRYCATLKHVKAGFKYNALVVWKVENADLISLGKTASEQHFVSHCYERALHPEWPYNLYTMVHALDENSLDNYIKTLSGLLKVSEYKVLKTIREFKKQRIRYFE